LDGETQVIDHRGIAIAFDEVDGLEQGLGHGASLCPVPMTPGAAGRSGGRTYNPAPMSLAVRLQYLLPKLALTRLAGAFAGARAGALTQWAIRRFIARYGVNMDEAANPDPTAYDTFNAFFTRALKAGARPLADAAFV